MVALMLVLGGWALVGSRAQAANLLQNGDFSQPLTGTWNGWIWQNGWQGWDTTTNEMYDATPCVYMGAWGGTAGINQVLSAQAGVPYTITCVSSAISWSGGDPLIGELRLIFLDNENTVLLNTNINVTVGLTAPGNLAWAPYGFTAVSPVGTTQLKVEMAANGNEGNVFFDNLVLTAPLVYPTIDNVQPDGSAMMQATNAFSFTASSTATAINASGIQVMVNGADVSANLIITGSTMSKSVVYPVSSNRAYSVSIKLTDATGLVVTKSVRFDTFSPTFYTWEAEDWDFNGGQFTDNPQTNAYFGLTTAIPEVDYHETSAGTNQYSTWTYRPWADPAVPVPQTEVTSDLKRAQYANASDYDVGWFDANEWLNYTRTFPTGLYNVYARMSSPGSSTMNLAQVTGGVGTPTQTTVSLGNFVLDGGQGWSVYSWAPLLDGSGNLVKLNLGGVSTLRVTAGGNANFQFLMLVPADTNAPAITGLYPDGTTQFQPTNKLSFTVSSVSGINPSGIQVTLSVTNVAVHYTTNLTSDNGLVIGGTATSRSVSYAGLIPNATYSAVITVADLNNNTTTVRPRFDTYSPVLTWEGEDYDYGSGQYLNNPAVDAYANLLGTQGIDFNFTNTGGTRPYRPNDGPAAGIIQDTPRTQYVAANTNDYAVGYFTWPEWINYTRSFPAGTYNVYGRFAVSGGTSYLTLGQVTNGAGTYNQGTLNLGNWAAADTGGWGSYRFTPLRDQFGNLAQVTLNGPTTLKVARNGGVDANINFFMLLPADTSLPTITQVSPLGMLQSTNKLQFVASGTAGIATSNIVVKLNGVTVTNLSCTGSATSWNVSAVLAPNTTYTAVLTVTDNKGQVASTTVSFDTFSATSYTWEAEDYDYTDAGRSGLFYDNPQVGSYMGLSGLAEVDFHKSSGSGGTQSYRLDAVETEPCTDAVDALRPQYAAPGTTDYDVGYTGTGDWWNYTRTYPAGKFNVYFRVARGSGGTATMGLQQVTSGVGTSTQTTAPLGSFSIPGTGGWQTYTWVPLKDSAGNLAVVALNGKSTLRLTDGGANLNFLALTPAAALDAVPSAGKLNLSFGTQNGFSYTVLYKNSLSDSTWTELSTFAGDGTVKTVSPAMTGPSRFYRLQVH